MLTTDPQTLDEVILGILVKSEHGRQWLEDAAQKDVMERQLLDLQSRGLSRALVGQMWEAGDAALIAEAHGLTDDQIESMNRASQRRSA